MKHALFALAAAAGLAATAAQAQVGTVDLVTSGLSRPLYLVQPRGEAQRLFIVEQRSSTTGRVRVYKNGALLTTPFFTISPVTTGSEQGLLGLAFHPDFLTNGWVFVNYTNNAGDTIIERLRVSNPAADVATIAERQRVLFLDQPFSNHNGGWIDFGPDGFLYIAVGDGGSGNDPNNAGQTASTLFGKMLRIDVDGPDNVMGTTDDDGFPADNNRLYTIPPSNPWTGANPGADEVWAWGLRNHWRNAFDTATGDLWIADVGQNAREEVNFQPASSAGGENYGWRPREGFLNTGLGGGTGPFVDPVFDYDHSSSIPPVNLTGCSITGGYVYRGCQIPSLVGKYLFADYCQGWVSAYDPVTGASTQILTGQGNILSFGQDNAGELYILTQGGAVRRIVPSSITDCNNNARQDACDIAAGTSTDINNDGQPDECECIADIDGNPGLDLGDFFFFFGCYDADLPCADIDGVPGVDLGDFFVFFQSYGQDPGFPQSCT